jgi:hypothetical protein
MRYKAQSRNYFEKGSVFYIWAAEQSYRILDVKKAHNNPRSSR